MTLDGASVTSALTGLGGAMGGLVAGALWVRKRISADNIEIERNTRERDVMSDIMRERDHSQAEVTLLRGQVIETLRATAEAEMRARLAQGDFAHLARRYERLRSKALRMAQRLVAAGLIDPVDVHDYETRFGGLDELGPPPEPKRP
jgi:hypothetical protein